MHKIIAAGAGRMGIAIAYGLHKLGYQVIITDRDSQTLSNAHEKLAALGVEAEYFEAPCNGDFKWFWDEGSIQHDVKAVASALPYSINKYLARSCAERRIPMCDLGGNPEESKTVQSICRETETPVFTDLGLAPGFANILAEHCYKITEGNVHRVQIRVGGLPEKPTGRLKYNLTFNVCGLVNEYFGTTQIIRNGKIKTVRGMSDVEVISARDGIFRRRNTMYECFHTVGGLSTTLQSMASKNVQHCDYKTVRFRGHADYINFLVDDCKFYRDDLYTILETACPPTVEDWAFIRIVINYKTHDTIIQFDKNWTAMQKGTSFPTAVIAGMMAEGKLKKSPLTYADVNVNELIEGLDKIDDSTKWRPSNWS